MIKQAFVAFWLVLAVLSAAFGQVQTTGAGLGAPGGGVANSITYAETDAIGQVAGGSANPYTISGATIGTASAYRKVIVALNTNAFAPVTTMTIGGVSATLRVANSNSDTSCQLWDATVTTGTTANIVVTGTSSTSNNQQVVVGTITGTSAVATYVSQSVLVFGFYTNPLTAAPAITVAAGGIAVGGFADLGNVTLTSTNMTIGTQTQLTSGNPATGTMAIAHSSTAGSLTPSYSSTGSVGGSICIANYSP